MAYEKEAFEKEKLAHETDEPESDDEDPRSVAGRADKIGKQIRSLLRSNFKTSQRRVAYHGFVAGLDGDERQGLAVSLPTPDVEDQLLAILERAHTSYKDSASLPPMEMFDKCFDESGLPTKFPSLDEMAHELYKPHEKERTEMSFLSKVFTKLAVSPCFEETTTRAEAALEKGEDYRFEHEKAPANPLILIVSHFRGHPLAASTASLTSSAILS